MAEGRCLHIESDRRIVGLLLGDMPADYIHHAVHRVCEKSVAGGQRAYAVKSPAQYRISVYHEKFFHAFLRLPSAFFFSIAQKARFRHSLLKNF